jgi:hypothetical protein
VRQILQSGNELQTPSGELSGKLEALRRAIGGSAGEFGHTILHDSIVESPFANGLNSVH